MSMLQMWVDVQVGNHVPFFPGMDWDKVEHWDSEAPRRGDAATAVNIAAGLKTREVVREAMLTLEIATTKQLCEYCGMNRNTLKHHLDLLVSEGLIYKENVIDKFGQRNYWTLK